jgi:hypothetical protein
MSLFLGYGFSSYTEIGIVFSDLEYLLAYFVKLLGFFSFCLFLGVLIKRSAFALGSLFLWFLFEMITYGISLNQIKNTSLVDKVYDFFPLMSMWNLIKEPITRLSSVKNLQEAVGENSIKDYDVHLSSILIVLTWTLIFVYSSYIIIKKRDL